MIIRLKHIRKAGYCSKKSRDFFRAQGWDWTAFLREGKPEEDFLNTGDALAIRLVEAAHDRPVAVFRGR